MLEASLELNHGLGDEQAIAFDTARLSIGAMFHGDLPRAAGLLDEALFQLGDYERSAELHDESLTLKRGQGDRWHIAFSLFGLGRLAWRGSDLKARRRSAQVELGETVALGDLAALRIRSR